VGSVASWSVTQNGYAFDATMSRAGVVHLIQTFDPDWRSDVGEAQRSPNGQLQIALPAGHHVVRVRYRPAGLIGGAIASLAAAIFAWTMRRKRRLPHRAATAPIDLEIAPT
jgi:hypothetical protein